MSTLADLKNAQTTAAATYNAALATFYAAYIDLSALDAAVANSRVGGGAFRSFGGNLDSVRATILHAHPLATAPDPVPLSTRIATARDGYVALVTGS